VQACTKRPRPKTRHLDLLNQERDKTQDGHIRDQDSEHLVQDETETRPKISRLFQVRSGEQDHIHDNMCWDHWCYVLR